MSLIYSESLCLPDGKRVKMATKNMKESEYPPPSAILALTGHVISGVLVETLWRKLLTGEGNAFFFSGVAYIYKYENLPGYISE